jgi:hypothetical protein
MNRRRNLVDAQRFAARRQREDEAPRLAEQIPGLVSLRLEIEERSGGLAIKHTRHVMVGGAPALFVVCCGDSRCKEGVHDLTTTIMHALRARMTAFHGDDTCNGSLGPAEPCGRVLHFDAVAAYKPGARDAASQPRPIARRSAHA